MAIIFSSGSGAGNNSGILESAYDGFVKEAKNQMDSIFGFVSNAISGINPAPPVESVFVDSGFTNVPGTAFNGSNIDNLDDVQTRRITSQEPQLTAYIRKRAFGGLSDENDSRFMDSGEKLYLRATKILFEKKCNQIGSYEALTKASRLVSDDAQLDADRVHQIIELAEAWKKSTLKNLDDRTFAVQQTSLDQEAIEDLVKQYGELRRGIEASVGKIEELREHLYKKQAKLRTATSTTWVIDPDQKDIFGIGRGAGVIELTLISDVSTDLGIENDDGSFTLSIEDPYNLTKITSDDIEVSLAAAYGEQNSTSIGQNTLLLGPSTILDLAKEKEQRLRSIRANRVASTFGFPLSAVGNSADAEIIFEINVSSRAADKVVAHTTSIGTTSFNRSNFTVALSQLPAEQQLTITEYQLVDVIFSLLDQYVSAVLRLNKEILDTNGKEDVKYARRQLRTHYLGKNIVQPMDSVNIYIRGNTTKPNQVVGPLSSVLNSSKFVQDYSKDPDASDAIMRDEMVQFGIDKLISLDIYKAIRTGSFMRNAGTHVFGGVVSSATEFYNASNGSYKLNISGQSNLKWLNLSRVNTKPSLNQPKGVLEDPLTPFKFETDSSTGLIKKGSVFLDETNERIKEKLLLDKFGLYRGQTSTHESLAQDYETFANDTKIIYKHCPGMVYKWKSGVMVATLDANLGTSLQGTENDMAYLKRFVGVNVVETPFAGQDAADTVSLLITGFPYSAQRFYDNAKNVGTFSEAGSNASPSYFHSFFDITRSTNKTLGNFRPFRAVEMSGQSLVTRAAKLKLQNNIRGGYSLIENLRSQLAQAYDKLNSVYCRPAILGPVQSDDPDERDRQMVVSGFETIIRNLRDQIAKEEASLISAENEAKKSNIKLSASDIILGLDRLSSGDEGEAYAEFNKKIMTQNRLQRFRPQFNCKFNLDQNLLIISDKYDNDLDIQSFVRRLTQQQNIFESEYKTPIEICREVAKTIDFELFADSQGHIQFRPPQYNRIPLSLLLKLFVLNRNNNTQLYPDFITEMFKSRLSTTKDDEEVLEWQIQIESLSLGRTYKQDAALVSEVISGLTEEELVSGQYLKTNSSTINKILLSGISQLIVGLRNRIEAKTGRTSNLQDIEYTKNYVYELNNPQNLQVNSMRLKVADRLRALVGKLEQTKALRSKLEAQEPIYTKGIGNFSRETFDEMIAPFQDLIQDDYYDVLGPGSAKRFIIYDDQIISSSFTESDANAFCRVDVYGEIDFIGDNKGNIAPGIPSLWAGATDFDMWRQYGYRALATTSKPFLKNAAEQCAPYALFLLSKARRDIVKGRVTVYGNEYYQIGDVVYLNSRDLLFYVTSVRHQFSYENASFTTELELRYGHALGEYIPTPLDVIGKTLIRNQVEFNDILISRETVDPVSGIHIGMVIFGNAESEDEFRTMLSDPYSKFNISELQRSILLAKNYVNKEGFPKVEVRGWVTSDNDKPIVQKRMDSVIKWLKSPRGSAVVGSTSDYTKLEEQYEQAKMENENIHNEVLKGKTNEITPVNLLSAPLSGDNLKYSRIPSDEVYNASDRADPTNIIELVLILG